MNLLISILLRRGVSAQAAGWIVQLGLAAAVVGAVFGLWQWRYYHGHRDATKAAASQIRALEMQIKTSNDEATRQYHELSAKAQKLSAEIAAQTEKERTDYESKIDQIRQAIAARPSGNNVRLFDPGEVRSGSNCPPSASSTTADRFGIAKPESRELSSEARDFLLAEADRADRELAETDVMNETLKRYARTLRAALRQCGVQ